MIEQARPGPGEEPLTIAALTRNWRLQAGILCAVVGIVAVESTIAEIVHTHLTARVAMIFLAGVLITGLRLGQRPAVLAAVLSTFSYAFFVGMPRGLGGIHYPGDVITLVFFLILSAVTGALAGQSRDDRQQVRARARSSDALYRSSRELSAMAQESDLRTALAARIADAAGGAGAILADGRLWSRPGAVVPGPALLAAATAAACSGETVSVEGWRVRAMHAGGFDLGIAMWREQSNDRDRAGTELISVLADLGAAAIARARLAVAHAEVEGLARAQGLLTTLLASISHDFRTPLTAILASASSLRLYGEVFSVETRTDLLVTIEEEATRLNRFVANLMSMTKLEAGAIADHFDVIDIGELLHDVAGASRRRARDPAAIRVDAEPRLQVRADPLLLAQALANVLDNAVRFSPAGAAVTLSALRRDGAVHVAVDDAGPGVPEAELPRIFEKFYRSPGAAPFGNGTGLGLSITRGLIEAMHGRVSAQNRGPSQPGLRVTVEMPEAML